MVWQKVENLRQIINSLDPLPEEAPEYTWLRKRIALRQHILAGDPDKFLEWSTITANMDTNWKHQYYHIDQWENRTGLKVSDLKSIVEFGGGYGAMIRACHSLGFTGDYYSYDFPEFIALQKFYLPEIDIKTDMPQECDLLIAICSMSEADLDTRQKFLANLSFRHCLICYQGRWDGIDNHQFFKQFPGKTFQDKLGNHWYHVS